MVSKIKKIPTPWVGLPPDFDPSSHAGFIYVITEIGSGRSYIGKKMFWRNLRIKVKGRKNRKKIRSKSDWRYYKSSSNEVLQGIRRKGLSAYEFRIVSCHKTRSEVNYTEVKELFKQEVLHTLLPSGGYKFLNKNIGGKWYRGKV